MATNNDAQQSQTGPIAQQLTKIQSKENQATTSQLSSRQPVKRDKWGFADKSFWEWIILIGTLLAALGAIAIPFMVTFLGLYATQQITQQQIQSSQEQHQIDLHIASDQQQETALATYLDTMTNLMLSEKLLSSNPNDEVRIVAWVQTLTVLRRIDPIRKDIVLRFLFESGLTQIIRLDDANLSGIYEVSLRPLGSFRINHLMLEYADLTHTTWGNLLVDHGSFVHTDMSYSRMNHLIITYSNFMVAIFRHITISNSDFSSSHFDGADLRNATLNNVSLKNADLNNADFSSATLKKVDFSEANLSGANFKGATGITVAQLEKQAKSLKGATMPDGTIHP